jgi:PST family polysaccharide transporter
MFAMRLLILIKSFSRFWKKSIFSRPLFSKSASFKNLLYLYFIQAANYLLPLVTLPHLARALGPESFGKLLLAQAIAQHLFWILEYGFMFSATRQASQVRYKPEELGKVLAGVIHARLLLLPVALLFGVLIAIFVPPLRGEWSIVGGLLLASIGSSFNFTWFFQALEMMRTLAVIEVGTRFLSTLGVFLFVRGPEDAALPLYLQALGLFLSNGLGFFWALEKVAWPGFSGGLFWLRKGFNLFVYNLVAALYSNVNLLLASLLLPMVQVSHYAAGERLVRPLVNLWAPINRLLFPRLSFQVIHDPKEARRWMVYGGAVLFSVGLGLSGLLFLSAPFLVQVMLGPGYEEVTPLLKVMAFFLLFSALSSFLGLQVLLPLGREQGLLWGTLLGACWNIGVGWYAAVRWGAHGLAWTLVAGEAWVLGCMLFTLWRWKQLEGGRG